MGTLDIDAYKDFVLKLKIKKADGSPQEIRRVCLPRIVDRNGLVSFQQLVDLVITFHFPSCGGSSPEDFVYSLTYFDVDEDVITIASNDELADAMEQFVDKKVLRITTEVKRKASSSSSLKPSPNDTKEAPSQPQIQNVLDSFVGVLASTVNSIENGLVAPSSSSKGVEASSTQPTTVQPCKPAAAGSLKSPTTTTEPLSLRPHKEAQKETTEEACPFIHGRHTCDSCLKTPIIGKRFHATNIKDYDLCQGCYENYKGTELEFESAELQRDRPFQKRWNRRRRRLEDFKMMKERKNRRNNRGPGQPKSPKSPPKSSEDVGATPTLPTAPREEETANFDDALEEAIRRSLEDMKKEEETEQNAATNSSMAAQAETMEHHAASQKEDTCADALKERAKTLTEDSLLLTDPSIVEDAVDEQELFQAMETMSVNSEKMVSAEDDPEHEKKPAAVDRSGSTPERKLDNVDTINTSPRTTTEDSFALDAVGNGDVAEAMGATLDTIAGVISEMLSEAETHSNPQSAEGDQCETLLSMKKKSESIANVETGEEKEEEAPGALILNSEDQDSKTLDVEGWHVVEEVAEPDKEIGLCTQMLGSTLFNSDMRSSQEQENVSALTGSDSFSAATSVPSTVSSIHLGTDVSYVAPEQRNRWASQLEKLHELGFDDETLCVETLERLHAANIGCNEQDEVSVTQVVNAILEK